jgi:Integrase core domain
VVAAQPPSQALASCGKDRVGHRWNDGRDKPIAPGSPWQNGFAKRLIGSIRRECVDHICRLGRSSLTPDSDEVCRLL